MITRVVRLIVDDTGQDLIEYALLAAFVGTAGMALFPTIVENIRDAYSNWVSDAQAAWEPRPPSGGP